MNNPKEGLLISSLKNKLDQCRRRQAILANKYNMLANRFNSLQSENRLLRQQLITAKKTMLPMGDSK